MKGSMVGKQGRVYIESRALNMHKVDKYVCKMTHITAVTELASFVPERPPEAVCPPPKFGPKTIEKLA